MFQFLQRNMEGKNFAFPINNGLPHPCNMWTRQQKTSFGNNSMSGTYSEQTTGRWWTWTALSAAIELLQMWCSLFYHIVCAVFHWYRCTSVVSVVTLLIGVETSPISCFYDWGNRQWPSLRSLRFATSKDDVQYVSLWVLTDVHRRRQ